jgi:hypothetical protein
VRGATFEFVIKEIGLEITQNHVLGLEPIGNDLTLMITLMMAMQVLSTLFSPIIRGTKKKFILKSFPDYKSFYGDKLSDK